MIPAPGSGSGSRNRGNQPGDSAARTPDGRIDGSASAVPLANPYAKSRLRENRDILPSSRVEIASARAAIVRDEILVPSGTFRIGENPESRA
jgi:hypothetical protein